MTSHMKNAAEGEPFDVVKAVAEIAAILVGGNGHAGGSDMGPIVLVASRSLSDILGEKTAQLLADGGYTTIEALGGATVEDLVSIPGIGSQRATRIMNVVESRE